MRRRRRGQRDDGARRKRFRPSVWTLVVVLVITVPVALLAVQTWNIVAAIAQVQDLAVVPLPESPSSILGGDQLTAANRPDDIGETRHHVRLGPMVPGGAQSDELEARRVSPISGQPQERSRTAGGAPVVTSDWDVARTIGAVTTERGDPLHADVWQEKKALTVLVLGVDRRARGGDQNADTIIIARLDLDTGEVRTVSIPRDLLVEIPGVGEGKINGAYDAGVRDRPGDPVAGVVGVRDAVEATFGVAIDGYVLVDFAGFESVIDAVGGIDLVVPEAIRDEAYPTEDFGTQVVEFAAGKQHLDGERALQYARIRNPDSDDRRRERQFQVIIALLERGQQFGSIIKAAGTVVALGNAVQTSLTLEEQLTLARIAMSTETANVTHVVLGPPNVTAGWTEEGAWVYRGDPVAVKAFVQQVLAP